MTGTRKSPADARLLIFLEKNLGALEQLTVVLTRLEQALPHSVHQRAGLLSYAEVSAMLGVGYAGLYARMKRGTFPRPVHGKGTRAFWSAEDIGHHAGNRWAKKRGK